MVDPNSPIEGALAREDASAVVASAAPGEIARLRAIEDLFEKRHQRKARSSKFALASQALVGYVALGGFFANAYQNWNNKREAEDRAKQEDDRWSKEFKRAQDADKYRAFFETSALATDSANSDKRLVGYALLKEFVSDKDYNTKATLMLEESLAQELRDSAAKGLDESHRAAVAAILAAISDTSDCKSLERAARSVDKLAKHHAKGADVEETAGLFQIYVRRLVGRAAQACANMKDFRAVRKPIRDTAMKLPELVGGTGKLAAPEANAKVAELLRDRCAEEIESAPVTDCLDVWKGYQKLCSESEKRDPKEFKDDAESCRIMRESAPPPAPAASAPEAAPP